MAQNLLASIKTERNQAGESYYLVMGAFMKETSRIMRLMGTESIAGLTVVRTKGNG